MQVNVLVRITYPEGTVMPDYTTLCKQVEACMEVGFEGRPEEVLPGAESFEVV